MSIQCLYNTFGPRNLGIRLRTLSRMEPIFTKPRAIFGTDIGGIYGFCITPLAF